MEMKKGLDQTFLRRDVLAASLGLEWLNEHSFDNNGDCASDGDHYALAKE